MNFKIGYSIKKVIASSFLFLATTIMLAHAIIPHHHHNGLIFTTITAHHDHDCNSHDAQSEDDSCDYPLCSDGIENCELATFFARNDSERRTVQLSDFAFDLFSSDFILFTNDHIPPLNNDIGLSFRQNPFLPSYYSEYVSQSHGLRAPPFELL